MIIFLTFLFMKIEAKLFIHYKNLKATWVLYMSSRFRLLGVYQAEKETTACKVEQIHKMITQNIFFLSSR